MAYHVTVYVPRWGHRTYQEEGDSTAWAEYLARVHAAEDTGAAASTVVVEDTRRVQTMKGD